MRRACRWQRMHADLAAVVGVHLARLLLRPAPVEAPAPGGRPQRVLVLRQQVRAVLAARAGRLRGLPLCAGSTAAVSRSCHALQGCGIFTHPTSNAAEP